MSHDPLDHGRRNVVLASGAAVALGLAGRAAAALDSPSKERRMSTLVIRNARITTLDPQRPHAQALAVQEGRIVAVGSDEEIMRGWGNEATLIDAQGRRLLPGLNDSHTHLIRGGLNYNLELRWDGLRSLGDALDMLKAQVDRTPAPQWVRVVGGFTAAQFNEKRLPTLQELNDIAPDTPVFLLHLYDRALLNRAALRACGYSKDTPDPPGGQIVRDSLGNPTGLLLAKPNALILYATLAKGPRLPIEYQANSTRHFMRELNRLGITSVIDAGGGFQNYPEDYQVIEQLHRDDQLTVRIAYNLFTQKPKEELSDFKNWTGSVTLHQGDDYLRHNGAGEMLVFSAADFEDFLEPRPDLPLTMEQELEPVVRHLVEQRWPFRLHATYDESISRMLDVFEKVNRDIPFNGLPWFFDHAETITPKNIERVRALGGGIAIQDRMAFQGEYFVERYGAKAAEATPPIKRMLAEGVPVGAGTDATRVSSYNPWTSLYWMVSGRTVGGLELHAEGLPRLTALELFTHGSAWFSSEQGKKSQIKVGQLADVATLSADFFSVDEEAIKWIESVLTVVGGKVVYGAGDFEDFAPPRVPVLPDWSPVLKVPGHWRPASPLQAQVHQCSGPCGVHSHSHEKARLSSVPVSDFQGFWGAFGCSCFAF